MTDDFIIHADNLTKIYKTPSDEIKVFENINLNVKKGSAVAIIGESGRGKTTLLNILSGLDRPSSGEVYFNNIRIDNLDEDKLSDFRNKNVGFIFQHHYLLNDFNALENILIPIRIGGTAITDSIIDKALNFLTSVGLQDRLTHFPDQLSGGERQRISIIRALIHDPFVIFADEPTGSLDKRNSSNIETLLWDLKNKYNKTFIIATHNLDIAKKCDQIIDLG